jgi:putative SOS response-associated peptidase YedK
LRRQISISSLPPNSSVEGCTAHVGVWSIDAPLTTDAPASALTPRAETLEQRATSREAFQQRRCVVPADTEVTFTIVTCAANPVIGEIHDRMPVILDEPAAEDWMNWKEEDPLSLKRLLVPAPSELRPVRVVDAYTESEHRTGCSL